MASVIQLPPAAPPAPAADTPVTGIVLLLAGIALFSLQDVLVRWLLAGGLTVPQIVCLRSALVLAVLAPVAWRLEGRRAFRTLRPDLHLLRGAANAVAYLAYYMALVAIPLADVVALFFAAPLFLTVLAVPVLGERPGVHRWTALAVGFVGVLVMLRPGSAVFEPAALLALLAALGYAVMQIVTRRLAGNDSALCMSMSVNAFMLLIAALLGVGVEYLVLPADTHASLHALLAPWAMPGLRDAWLLLGVALVASAGYVLLTRAYSIAPTSTIAPFEYSMMLWALLWGALFFAEFPDAPVLAGAALTAGAGLYVLRREAIAQKRALAEAGALALVEDTTRTP